jgi:hypothetical protein
MLSCLFLFLGFGFFYCILIPVTASYSEIKNFLVPLACPGGAGKLDIIKAAGPLEVIDQIRDQIVAQGPTGDT